MFPPQAEIKAKITHNGFLTLFVKYSNFNSFHKQRVKIIQSFANEKIILLMALSIYKWLMISFFSWFIPQGNLQLGTSSKFPLCADAEALAQASGARGLP